MLRRSNVTLFQTRFKPQFQAKLGGINSASLLQSKRALASILLDRVVNHIEKTTNPDMIKQILIATALDQFKPSDVNFSQFLIQIQLTPLDASKLIDKTKQSLLDIKPIRHLLAHIQRKELISEAEIQNSAVTLQFQMNLMYLFEGLTISTINSRTLGEEIFAYILEKRKSPDAGNTAVNFVFGFPWKTSVFERLKMVSVDPGMAKIARYKSTGDREETIEDTKAFEEKYQLSQMNADSEPVSLGKPKKNVLKSSLAINIFEAAWQDAKQSTRQGNIDNAISAFGLIGILEHNQFNMQFENKTKVAPVESSIDDMGNYELLPSLQVNLEPIKFGEIKMDKTWRDLYSTWNLFFIISNVDSVFLPIKLLTPSVLSAPPEQYIESRVILLFIMANIFFAQKIKNNALIPKQIKLEHAEEMFKVWGELNKQFAEQALQDSCPTTDKSAAELFEETFGDHVNLNFMKHMARFVVQQDKFELTNLVNNDLSKQSLFKYTSQKIVNIAEEKSRYQPS